jgi:hypothetical protein
MSANDAACLSDVRFLSPRADIRQRDWDVRYGQGVHFSFCGLNESSAASFGTLHRWFLT